MLGMVNSVNVMCPLHHFLCWEDRNMLFLEQPEDYIYGGLTWKGLSHFICVYIMFIYIYRKRVTDVTVTSFAKCM